MQGYPSKPVTNRAVRPNMGEMDPTDAELIARMPHDEAAFGVFYRRHVEDVLGFLRRRSGSAGLAADVCSEVFATVLLRCGRFDPSRGEGRAWLFAIARHKLIDAQRRGSAERSARRRLGVPAITLDGADVEAIDALGSDPEAYVAELPPDQRDAVRGRVLDELTYEDLARDAGVSPAAMRQRVSRGLAALRARMEER